MDPIGPQKKIKSNQHNERFEKLVDGGGAKNRYEGERNMSSGTRGADKGRMEGKWQGTVKGKTKHTFGVE